VVLLYYHGMDLSYLKSIGLSEGEVKVYSALLEIGISSLHTIQEKTGIDRRNIYDILNKLIEKGLVSYTIEKGKRTYQITHPSKIVDFLDQQKQQIQEHKKVIEEKLPDLLSIFQEKKFNIRAETFRGNEAIKALLTEALEYKHIYFIGGNSGVEQTNLKYWFAHWMEKRAEKKHYFYDLVDYGKKLEGINPNDIKKHKEQYYKYCSLPKNLSSPLVILIFGDKVAQILWSEQSFAFVLESKEIRESFMKYFHHFWKDPW